MDLQIAGILFQDGMTLGATYAMLAVGFVLVFTTTRIIFASYGDLIVYSALTLYNLQHGNLPGTVLLLIVLAAAATLLEAMAAFREGRIHVIPRSLLLWFVLPAVPAVLAYVLYDKGLGPWTMACLTIALVLPIGPLLYRIVFQPIETASTLTLLIVAIVLHYVVSGLALMFFGPEGVRTAALFSGSMNVAGTGLPAKLVAVIATAVLLSAALAAFFNLTLTGKALRATAFNRDGARLVGISTTRSGTAAFLLASLMAACVGILLSSTVTIYYDSGLMIGLKGFVGAVVGGFVSYPLAAVGSLIIGLVESYSSFYSSAFKEVIVYLGIIPIILMRWIFIRHQVIEIEEEV